MGIIKMSDIEFKSKYLKYKSKYLDYKNFRSILEGGAPDEPLVTKIQRLYYDDKVNDANFEDWVKKVIVEQSIFQREEAKDYVTKLIGEVNKAETLVPSIYSSVFGQKYLQKGDGK